MPYLLKSRLKKFLIKEYSDKMSIYLAKMNRKTISEDTWNQTFPFMKDVERKNPNNGIVNRLDITDRAFHDWYRFVLAYPPHLVRDYIRDFGLKENQTVLDPFCGTGTTLIEAKLLSLNGIGVEANPFAHFASKIKTNWKIDPGKLRNSATELAAVVNDRLIIEGLHDDQVFDGNLADLHLKTLNEEEQNLIITDSISPIPLHKALTLLEEIHKYREEEYYYHLLLAFANTLVFSASNLRFGPEVGVGKIKQDASVISSWVANIEKIASDLTSVQGMDYPDTKVYFKDSRDVSLFLEPHSVDAVITSPPYPNEKDYTRTTRLESVVLGLFQTKKELRQFKKTLVRSNTRSVYKEDNDAQWVEKIEEIQNVADEIEKRRIELKKTSGFEKLYSTVTRSYFGGMARHLAGLRTVLKPGAKLAYVVGDQGSYLRVMIPTGQLLSIVAKNLGYREIRTDLFRTRFATGTKMQLREEVLVLEWPG